MAVGFYGHQNVPVTPKVVFARLAWCLTSSTRSPVNTEASHREEQHDTSGTGCHLARSPRKAAGAGAPGKGQEEF